MGWSVHRRVAAGARMWGVRRIGEATLWLVRICSTGQNSGILLALTAGVQISSWTARVRLNQAANRCDEVDDAGPQLSRTSARDVMPLAESGTSPQDTARQT
jgi:hypothetical protein